jgi:hypothetical protein
MSRVDIIGLCGLTGSGKNTVAQLLGTHLGFSQWAFADAMRQEICSAFCIDMSLLTRRSTRHIPVKALALKNCSTESGFAMAVININHWVESGSTLYKEYHADRSPEQIEQWWRTDFRLRQNGPEYFSRKLKARLYIQQQSHLHRHVISDLHSKNDVDAVRSMGGVIWQIKRPEINRHTLHASESDGTDFVPNLVINNCHDIKHLQGVVTGAWLMAETGLDDADVIDMGATYSRLSRA